MRELKGGRRHGGAQRPGGVDALAGGDSQTEGVVVPQQDLSGGDGVGGAVVVTGGGAEGGGAGVEQGGHRGRGGGRSRGCGGRGRCTRERQALVDTWGGV